MSGIPNNSNDNRDKGPLGALAKFAKNSNSDSSVVGTPAVVGKTTEQHKAQIETIKQTIAGKIGFIEGTIETMDIMLQESEPQLCTAIDRLSKEVSNVSGCMHTLIDVCNTLLNERTDNKGKK